MITDLNFIKIYRTNFNDHLKELQNDVIPKLDEKFFSKDVTSESLVANGYISFFDEGGSHLDEWSEFAKFMEFIRFHINEYSKSLELTNNQLEITNMWANKYPTHSFIREHAHIIYKNLYSIVFYMKKPNDSGNLYIRDHSKGIDLEITSDEGDVIIFPSNVTHYTSPNNNTADKYIIGLDFCFGPRELEDTSIMAESFKINGY